ncbi:MAG: translation-initiation factor 2-domain-containing protein [Olpidium bornovanus]|uniref:Translation-initiation factor 2-domain-containing protein n=1 Tax=Olpidium bornovanus TaxID=278681 RepID=A0A8H7ZW21_9FUNG|nr:MAG: translation-initiation factor 2-domain-containing protein [Olpidium bornovanus]
MTDIRAEVDGPVEGYPGCNCPGEARDSKGWRRSRSGDILVPCADDGERPGQERKDCLAWDASQGFRMEISSRSRRPGAAGGGRSEYFFFFVCHYLGHGWSSRKIYGSNCLADLEATCLPFGNDVSATSSFQDEAARVVKARSDFRFRQTMKDKVITAMNAGRLEQSQELAEKTVMAQLYKKAIRSYYKGTRAAHPSLPDGYVIRRGVVKKTGIVFSASDRKKDEEGEETHAADRGVKVMIKADVAGSAEAIVDALQPLPQHIVSLQILSSAVGPVTSGDVDYALSSEDKVVILAFNAAPNKEVQEKAKQKKVSVQSYDVIYALLDDVQAMMEEKLPPKVSWTVLGEAEVLKRFDIDARKGSGIPVAGSKVLDGVIKNGCTARILRNDEVIWEGECAGLGSSCWFGKFMLVWRLRHVAVIG